MSDQYFQECRKISNTDWANGGAVDFYNANIFKQLVFAGKIETFRYLSRNKQAGFPLANLDTTHRWVYVPSTSVYAKYDNCCQTYKARNSPLAGSVDCFGVFGRTNGETIDRLHVDGQKA